MMKRKNNKKMQNEGSQSLMRKKLSRREFLVKGAQAGMVASVLGSGTLFSVPPARAAKSLKGKGEVIVCSWGGSFQDFQRKAIFEPFTKETGIKVIDTATPSSGKIKAQIDSKNIEWDIGLLDVTAYHRLGENYLEKIDYSYFEDEDYKNIPENFRRPYTCAAYFFSYILAYRTDKFPQGLPKTWADFADFNRYPGKRVFARGHGAGVMHLPIALIGMGVPLEQARKDSTDLKTVWAFYDKIKPHVIQWWDQGAQPIQMLKAGEVHMACAYSARMQELMDAGEPVGFTWHGGEMAENSYCILKGAKNAENAMKFIAFACRAKPQADLAEFYPYGPSNLRAVDYVKPQTRAKLNTAPENIKQQIFYPWEFLMSKTLDPKREQLNREYLADQWQAWSMK
jgi:putative spermidine/putrescine transport system substrate-binding protein